jgi:hypothetical protein
MITNDERCTREIKARIAMAKAAFNKKTLFASKLDLDLRKERVNIWIIALYGAETWILRKLDQKYLESFEIWCWRRMEKIIWMDRVNNEAVLDIVKEERNILHTMRRRKANWVASLKEKLEGQEGEEGDVSSCWMTGRKQEDTGSWRKLRIALFVELSLEEAMDLSQDRLLLDLTWLGLAANYT